MNDQSEAAPGSATSHWFGLDRLRLSDGDQAIEITIGTERHWDRSHLRRLRQSGDLPGMVPIIDSDFSADGKPFAVTPVIDQPSLSSLIESGELDWASGAGITEAAARAAHEAHLRGLFHGALAPDDVYLIGDDVAIAGVGLGLGGIPPAERAVWVAPEVREGAEPTERSDVYSLGKILETSLGEALDTVPRSIRRLIMWSSSDTPEARPPSAMEFASILAEGLGEDRKTYGPAFIPTADTTELVSRASSAVSNHTLSPTAHATASAAGGGIAGAGLVAATSAYLAEGDAGLAPDLNGPAGPGTAGDTDPGVELDEGSGYQPAGALEAGEEAPAGAGAPVGEEHAAPLAAETIELDETQPSRRRGNRAGAAIGVILVLGLVAIVWGIVASGDGEVAETSPTTGSQAIQSTGTQAVTGTAAEVTTTATAPATSTTASTEAPAPSTSEVVEADTAALAATADGPIATSDAAVQLLHGLPGTDVDAYLDGEAVAASFEAGTIAGPIELAPGSHDLQLFASADVAPLNAEDRTDQPLVAGTVAIGEDPISIVAHLDAGGGMAISTFPEDMAELEPGSGRLTIRNLMAGDEVDAAVDGGVIGSLAPGEEAVVEVAAGAVLVELLGADGVTIDTHTVNIDDGELASLSAIGAPSDGSAEVVIQRYTGLSTAPVAVPTGNSGLLGTSDGQAGLWIAYGLMVALVLSGGLVAFRRQRSLS